MKFAWGDFGFARWCKSKVKPCVPEQSTNSLSGAPEINVGLSFFLTIALPWLLQCQIIVSWFWLATRVSATVRPLHFAWHVNSQLFSAHTNEVALLGPLLMLVLHMTFDCPWPLTSDDWWYSITMTSNEWLSLRPMVALPMVNFVLANVTYVHVFVYVYFW